MTYHITKVTKSDLKDYPKALKKAYENAKKASVKITISNWLQEKINNSEIRLNTKLGILPDGNYTLDFGNTFRGKSPEEALKTKSESYTFICLLQYLRLITEYPEIATEIYYLDLPLDEVRYDGAWSFCPFVGGDGSEAWVDGYFAGNALGDFGSFGCAGESGNLDGGTLDLNESLVFDAEEIRKLKEFAKLLK